MKLKTHLSPLNKGKSSQERRKIFLYVKYKNEDTYFDILTMSLGGQFEGSDPDKRKSEVINAWVEADADNCSVAFDSLKPKDNSEDKLVNLIETKYLSLGYDAIFIPTYEDSHFEHRKTNKLASALTRCKNISVIEYRTPSTLHEWNPNMFVDISEVYNKKISMLSKFNSQSNKKYFGREILDSFHIDFQSSKKGNKFVEQFKIIQIYGI